MIITSEDLYSFGQWARYSPNGLGYKSPAELMIRTREPAPAVTPRYPVIDDHKAALIDRALCKLKEHDPHLARLFFSHYVACASYRTLAARYDCHRSKIAEQINRASGYVIGVVSAMD